MLNIAQFIIFCSLLMCYFMAPSCISSSYMTIVILLVLSSFILLYSYNKTAKFLRINFLSNSSLFILLFSVVCFQFPIDYVLGNNDINFSNYFYNFNTINLSTTFNALCVVSFIMGLMSYSCKIKTVHSCNHLKIMKISLRPLLYIMYFMWIGFLIFLNVDYINGGHGVVPANEISIAFYGYFLRLNIIYLSLCIVKYSNKKNMSIKEAILVHDFLYIFILIISVFLFLLAHNRVYIIYLFMPVFFYILSVSNIKTKPLVSILLIFGIGFLFTFFKLLGIKGLFMLGDLNINDFNTYDRFSSFSPFTSELAGSILADSSLFYIWYTQGIIMFGSTLVYGVLRSFSGLVPLFYMLTGLSDTTYNSASYLTSIMSSNYGLGTSVSGDSLVSFGFVGTLILMNLFGRLCLYGDYMLFQIKNNFKGVLIGMCIASQIAFVERNSFSDIIATIIFCSVFSYIYMKCTRIYY